MRHQAKPALFSLVVITLLVVDLGSSPAVLNAQVELGPDDFQISDAGPDGDIAYDAIHPAVAYNSVRDEFLVVWHGDDNVGGAIDNEVEIFGQRVDAQTGAQVGPNDFRISNMGPGGNLDYGAFDPAVEHNPNDDLFLVAWTGDTTALGHVDGELEIWGQLVDGTGSNFLSPFRISLVGGVGDATFGTFQPEIVYNSAQNEFLVIFTADHNSGGQLDDEFEIFGQRVNAATGGLLGSQFRISSAGGIGNTTYLAEKPSGAYNSDDDEYFVVWNGDDTIDGRTDNEFEITGQRLSNTGGPLGGAVSVSDAGGFGNTTYNALEASIAYNDTAGEYFAVWFADDNVGGLFDEEYEIFGQRITAAGAPTGANDILISSAGGVGEALYDAFQPYVVADSQANAWHALWIHDEPSVGDQFFEVYVATISADDDVSAPFRISDIASLHQGTFSWQLRFEELAMGSDNTLLGLWNVGIDEVLDGNFDPDFEVFGQLFKGAPIFSDGFESGDTSRWSSTTP